MARTWSSSVRPSKHTEAANEEVTAFTEAQRTGTRKTKLQFLAFACNKGALSTFVRVLLSITILVFQNQGLHTTFINDALVNPVSPLHNVTEPMLATRPESILPQVLHLEMLGQKLGTVLHQQQLGMPDFSFGENLPRLGVELRDQGLSANHPVFIMPGFVTSSLELWETLPCGASQKRKKIWGSLDMTRSLLLNKDCWVEHLRLDEATGLDPVGVKVRAGSGFQAIDYFVAGYYVWANLVDAFADLGYDASNLVTEPYDWRLSLPNLEKRDALYTRIQGRIEALVKAHDKKVMVVAHSWGDTVFRNFMAWVSASSPHWVEQNLAIYANVAGPTLGVPKAISSFLSGETRDTAEMGAFASKLANQHFSRAERTRLLRTWGGGMGMLPIGGNAIWGNATWAPDDPRQLKRKNVSYGPMITSWEFGDENVNEGKQSNNLLDVFRPKPASNPSPTGPVKKQLELEASLRLVMAEMGSLFESNAKKWSGIETREKCGAHLGGNDFHYSPLDCPLPEAPSLQMFCMYGVGNPTERAYHYQRHKTDKALETVKSAEEYTKSFRTELDVRHKIHVDVADADLHIRSGVLLSDGDGTVPLLSLGGLCQKHWQEPKLNPSGFRVVTREYKHEPTAPSRSSPTSALSVQMQKLRTLLRGGVRSAEHVDILSHEDVVTDLLLMASGHAGDVQQQIHSQIQDIAAQLE